MFWALLCLLELVSLFFLSQLLTRTFSFWLYSITRNQKITIYVMALLFFPGVIVHELAHFIMANILFVKTGAIEFFPQMQGEYVKLGSVAVAHSDPFRRLLIGIAPVFIGVATMLVVFMYFGSFFPGFNWQTAVLLYAFFEIGNTMFSSKKDMEGAIALFIALGVLGIFLYILGLRIQLSIASLLNSPAIFFVIQKLAILLAIPVAINIVSVGVIRGMLLRK